MFVYCIYNPGLTHDLQNLVYSCVWFVGLNISCEERPRSPSENLLSSCGSGLFHRFVVFKMAPLNHDSKAKFDKFGFFFP